jgi:hypothetical protein
MRRRKLRKIKRIVIITVISIFIGFFFIYLPYKNIKARGMEVVKSAKSVKDSFKKNDIDEMKLKLTDLDKKYTVFQKEAKKVYWMRYIPFLGSYVSDFKNGVSAGENMIKATEITIEAVAPYADLIGFKKGGSSFVEKSADERIQTAVLTLDKLVVKIDTIAPYIEKARESVDKINEKKYPVKIGKTEIREKIKAAKEQFEVIASFFVDAKPFLKKLPEILGKDEEKKYLVLFQNDKELRATGGFLTAYAIFKVKDGKFTVSGSEDIYSLDNSISHHPKAPPEILTYHKNVNQFNIRDSNLSPDFVTSLELFNSLYEKSSKKIKYDGVIAVDTHVLVDALDVLGDTEVAGVVFSAKNDKRCNCPQVIYTLFDIIDRPVPYLKENRKEILGDLLYTIVQKALGFSPSQYWGRLAQVLIGDLQEKHMLIYLTDKEAQKSVEKINFAGRIRSSDADYLHINDTNFAGQKSNLFVSHSVVSETDIDRQGKTIRKLTIQYKNPYPHSDCNLEKGELCLNATLRNWLRIYVPAGSKLISFQGSETKVKTYESLNKTVFEGFLRVNPLGKSEVVVEYDLPYKITSEKDYKLLIQKQPGTDGHLYKILINGKKKEEFKLKTDKEIGG